MRIAIIGGNLQGLFLSHMLLDLNDVEIHLFEEKAEVGFPIVGSGLLINHSNLFDKINTWISNMTFKSNIFNKKGMVFHRGWLEKDLARNFVLRGGNIQVRTIVDVLSSKSMSLKGAGGRELFWEGDMIIDCSLIIDSSIIGVLSLNEVDNGWQRSDNIWESWHSSDSNDLPEDIIEIISSTSNQFENNTIDFAFNQSHKLFTSISKGNDKE
jgi:hypothetical protein